MKIHLLSFASKESNCAKVDVFYEAAKKLNHTLEVIYANDCLSVLNKKPELFINGRPLKELGIKILVVRPGFAGGSVIFNSSLVNQFELCGVKVINNHKAILNTKDKLRTLQILSKHGIPIPKSFLLRSVTQIDSIAEQIGKPPYILKTTYGSKGKGVFIIESKRSLRSISPMFFDHKNYPPILVQKFIGEAEAKDIRAFVIGDKVVATMERSAVAEEEFRANFSLGGSIKKIKLNEKETKLAIKTAKILRLDIAGVDIIQSNEGPKILEVNSNPGLEGITQASGKDIAGEILKYAVKKAKK